MCIMERKEVLKKTTKLIANATAGYLKVDANSTSCIMFHQPKAPKELSRFKKKK